MLGTILVVILILLLVGALPSMGPHDRLQLGLRAERRSRRGAGDRADPAFVGPHLSAHLH
jgi:hypothetical protein